MNFTLYYIAFLLLPIISYFLAQILLSSERYSRKTVKTTEKLTALGVPDTPFGKLPVVGTREEIIVFISKFKHEENKN